MLEYLLKSIAKKDFAHCKEQSDINGSMDFKNY